MKTIIITPSKINFTYMVILDKQTKLEDLPIYQALHTLGKHLFVEYEENNDNLLKQCIDLDALGLSTVQTVEEFENIFGVYKPYQG